MTTPNNAMTPLDEQIGRSVRAAREDRKLAQVDLARQMEARGVRVHNSLISQVEGGTRRLWFTEALAIAAILDLPVTDLIDYEERAAERELAELRARITELETRLGGRGAA